MESFSTGHISMQKTEDTKPSDPAKQAGGVSFPFATFLC